MNEQPVTYLKVLNALKALKKSPNGDAGIVSIWVFPDKKWYVGERPFYCSISLAYGTAFLSELESEEDIKKAARSMFVEYSKKDPE